VRKALIVGIDHYDHIGGLSGCVNDAHSVKSVLERHADGTVNFATPMLLTGTSATDRVEKGRLKDAVRELFADDRKSRSSILPVMATLKILAVFCVARNASLATMVSRSPS
jgi:hypothetical protein